VLLLGRSIRTWSGSRRRVDHPSFRSKTAGFCRRLLLSATLAGASAFASEPVRFEYQAPPECPSEPVFVGRVRERSVHQRAAAPGEMGRSFVVTVALDAEGAVARVDFVDADGSAISRSVRGETCDEVVSGIALVTALAIDARASSETPKAPPASAPPPAPPPKPPPPPAPPPKPALRAPALVFTAGVGAGFTSYAAPSGALSFDVFLAASLGERGPLARLSAFHLRADLEDAPDAAGNQREGRLRTYGGKLEGCPLSLRFSPFFFEPCLGTNLGALLSSGVPSTALLTTNSETQLWWDAVLIGRLGVVIAGWAVVEAQGELGVPFVRPSFGFGEGEENAIFVLPRVGGSARVGVGIRFP
jgi:hypothetical protein